MVETTKNETAGDNYMPVRAAARMAGVPYRTAFRWAKERLVPVKRSDAGTVHVQPESLARRAGRPWPPPPRQALASAPPAMAQVNVEWLHMVQAKLLQFEARFHELECWMIEHEAAIEHRAATPVALAPSTGTGGTT